MIFTLLIASHVSHSTLFKCGKHFLSLSSDLTEAWYCSKWNWQKSDQVCCC